VRIHIPAPSAGGDPRERAGGEGLSLPRAAKASKAHSGSGERDEKEERPCHAGAEPGGQCSSANAAGRGSRLWGGRGRLLRRGAV